MTNFARLMIKGLAPIVAITVTAFCNVCFADHAPWNPDWDEQHMKYEEAKSDKSREGKRAFEGFRYIYLIRPGQADLNDRKKLSPLGRQQSRFTAFRMGHLINKKVYKQIIFPSKSCKSAETAKTITAIVPYERLTACDLIHSGYPIKPVPRVNFNQESKDQINADGIRLETAFRKYFYRPEVGTDTTVEIMVCPSNVIRYFVCRALQLPPEGWERMSLFNCSVTHMLITADGAVFVLSIGDFSHLPENKITPAFK